MVYGLEVVQLTELFSGVEGLLSGGYLLHFRGVEEFKVGGGKTPLARYSILHCHSSTAINYASCDNSL